MAALPDLTPTNGPALVQNGQRSDTSTNCYALNARHSNSNSQSFATTYSKAKQLLLQSGEQMIIRLTCRHILMSSGVKTEDVTTLSDRFWDLHMQGLFDLAIRLPTSPKSLR